MSTYVTVEGNIKYKDKAAFSAALGILTQGGWVDKDGKWLDDAGYIFDHQDDKKIDSANLTIEIPYACHRNLGRAFDDLLVGATDACIVSTCTDGCFDAMAIKVMGGKRNDVYCDLDDYAEDIGMGKVEYDDDNLDAYCEYQKEVEDAFFDEHMRGAGLSR